MSILVFTNIPELWAQNGGTGGPERQGRTGPDRGSRGLTVSPFWASGLGLPELAGIARNPGPGWAGLERVRLGHGLRAGPPLGNGFSGWAGGPESSPAEGASMGAAGRGPKWRTRQGKPGRAGGRGAAIYNE